MANIVTYFEDQVRVDPNRIAIEFKDRQWSYFQLNNYANFIAELLVKKGIKASSVVAVSGLKSMEMVAGIIAILKIKCSYMPIDVSLPTEHIQYMLANAKVDLILSHGIKEYKSKFNSVTHIDLNYENFDETIYYPNSDNIISSHDPAYIMHTSGSTGFPKGVIVPHRGVIRLLINTNYIDIKPSDSILFHSNTTFDAAIFEIWAALLNGARIIISPYVTGDVLSIFKLCQERGITILLLTTGLFHIFSTMNLERLSHLRYLVVGGDVMHSEAARRAINKNKTLKIINGYGPCENTVFTTCLVIGSEADIDNPVSIGRPINETQIYLLDEALNEVKEGEIGELYTSGTGLALGYINDIELTAEKFLRIPHLAGDEIIYRTGDMAKLLSSGNIQFMGRVDSQIKIRGFRVELMEIEYVISRLHFVEDVCVCIIGNQNRKIVAYIKVNQLYQTYHLNDKSVIFSFLKEKLPSYCIPAQIEINESFPLTRNGKIDRKLLQEQLNDKNNEVII